MQSLWREKEQRGRQVRPIGSLCRPLSLVPETGTPLLPLSTGAAAAAAHRTLRSLHPQLVVLSMDDLFGDLAPSSSEPQPQPHAASAASAQPASTAGFEDEEYDSVLFVARECYVYRLPARTSTAGYKAGDWVRNCVCGLGMCSSPPADNARRETWRPSSGKVSAAHTQAWSTAQEA